MRDKVDGLSRCVQQFLDFYTEAGESGPATGRAGVDGSVVERVVVALEVLRT
jgi:hypothetical protein